MQRYNLFPNRQNFFSIIFCHHTPPGGQPARCVLNFFSQQPQNPQKSPRKRQKNPFFHTFSGSRKFIFCEYLCILLSICDLNAFKYCGNKTEEYVITLFSSVLYRYLPKVREMDDFVRIRENLLSGTPHVRIPVHNTTSLGAPPSGSAGVWGAFTGTPPRDENRLYGKNGVSLHPFSGETQQGFIRTKYYNIYGNTKLFSACMRNRPTSV